MDKAKASRRREPDWVAIRRMYEDGEKTIAAIAAEHGITPSAIQRRRAVEGWLKRSDKITKRRNSESGDSDRKALIARLLKVVDRNLKLMEIQMESSEPGTAADRERETRAIGTLTRTIEKLTELQSEADVARSASRHSSGAISVDDSEADRLRLEIAERILRIGERYAAR
jgi:transposase-like protein